MNFFFIILSWLLYQDSLMVEMEEIKWLKVFEKEQENELCRRFKN